MSFDYQLKIIYANIQQEACSVVIYAGQYFTGLSFTSFGTKGECVNLEQGHPSGSVKAHNGDGNDESGTPVNLFT